MGLSLNGKVRFITLGCKVNQYETQAMREAVEGAGAVCAERADQDVDFVVINTCTVTGEADRENHYWIRRARRDHPQARIVVTGCMVTRDRAQLEALPEVDLVLSNQQKTDLVPRLLQSCGAPAAQDLPEESRESRRRYAPLAISASVGHSRAFVKIQDGCNHACSFCKVVLARGRSRSRELADILEEVTRLRDSGYREIVFAGIQLGAYGLDFPQNRAGLEEVLEACSKIEGIDRLRLSSIEPTDVKPSLLSALRDIPKCVPHLHIPLQSGDDEILAKMNRRYGRAFYVDLIARLRGRLADFSLTLDVMAGFPGEEETHFQNTLDLLETVKPLKCHVFPYSRREGTRAAGFEDVVESMMRERIERLNRAGERLGREARLPYAGRVMPVLVEHARKNNPLLQGVTANYLKVCFQGTRDWTGRIVPVKLLALQGDLFLGKAHTS